MLPPPLCEIRQLGSGSPASFKHIVMFHMITNSGLEGWGDLSSVILYL